MSRLLALLFALVLVPCCTARAATPWVGMTPVSIDHPAWGASSAVRMATSPSGHTVVAWITQDGTVYASQRDSGQAWSAPLALTTSPTMAATYSVAAAVDAAGDVTVAWPTVNGVVTRTARAGKTFTDAVTVSPAAGSELSMAMNAAGESVLAFVTFDASETIVSTSSTPGATWASPTVLSAAGKTVSRPHVAIDSAGDSVVVWDDFNTSTTDEYYARGAVHPAGGSWPAVANAIDGPSTDHTAIPVIDDAKHISVIVRQGVTGTVKVATRDIAPGVVNFTGGVSVANNCTSDTDPAISLDSAGTRTVAFVCGTNVFVGKCPAGKAFDAAGCAPTAFTTAPLPVLALAGSPNGNRLLAVDSIDSNGFLIRAYRAAPGHDFDVSEPISDPEVKRGLNAAAIADAGDALILASDTKPVGPMLIASDLYASSYTPPVATATPTPSPEPSATATSTPEPMATAAPTASPAPTPVAIATPTPTPKPAAKTCKVPKLKNKTLSAAKKALTKAGCKLGKVTRRKTAKGKNRISKQKPAAAQKVKTGTKVALTINVKKPAKKQR